MNQPPPWHLSAYALDELAGPDRAAFAAHLEASASERAALAELDELLPVVTEAAKRSVRRRRRRRWAAVAVGLAAAAVIAALITGASRVEIAAPLEVLSIEVAPDAVEVLAE